MGKIKYLYIMDKNLLSEEIIKNAFLKVISEETSKVKREDFSRVQYKIEELQNSLSETMKEMRKLEDCIPDGLKTISNGRVSKISNNLESAQALINQLKNKIREYKKSTFSPRVEENKK
jgi:predicted  nucleic acid-binding Zn-ribbon protein